MLKDKRTILLINAAGQENKNILKILEKGGYKAVSAYNAKDAIAMTNQPQTAPDIILICKDSSTLDALSLLKSLRKWYEFPIIMLSTFKGEHNIVESLDLGAYDYLILPFGTAEHMARIRSALRYSAVRRDDLRSVGLFSVGGLSIDYSSRMVTIDKRFVHLTPIEFRIVALLTRNAGRVLTHEQIIDEIWGPSNSDNLVLRVNMANIRRKIEPEPSNPRYIVTETGVGYKMATP